MTPLRARHRLGQPVTPRLRTQRAQAAAGLLPGAAPWLLLCDARDIAAAQGAAIDSWPARVGTAPTASGALRPAVAGRGLYFGGAQRMTAASGLIGGLSAVTSIFAASVESTTGLIWEYGTPRYFNVRGALAGMGGATTTLTVGNGESSAGNRNTRDYAIGTGGRVVASVHDRTQAGTAELQCYDGGEPATATGAFTNTTTSTFAAAQPMTIGSAVGGVGPITATMHLIGFVGEALDAMTIQRLSRLVAARLEW